MSRLLALVTCDRLPDGDPDDQALIHALARRGLDVSVVSWTDGGVDWATFDLTVIRTTWDYTARRKEFLDWARSVPRLVNPVGVIETNSDKRYLADLAEAGLPIVPTTFVGAGQPLVLPTSGEYILKPSVGAGSRGVGRFDASRPEAAYQARTHAATLHDAGRTVMLQPYLADVDTAGETALMFFEGRFSHAIAKSAMLPADTRHRVDAEALYVPESISARQATPAEVELATDVVAWLGRDEPLLYARIDLVPGPAGPVVIEAEVTEPSLYFGFSEHAADTFADAIVGRLG